ncbi:BREX-1 system adenine-specific DNA-methyltransferase PglX [Succinivibrio faecicola]|uniref:site-specific DNA-methyltransferase (adenine-specific) n=1 Tax=Succinivibrio faecicola TaxID=2820300 RepID=A0ABS7DI45_9GAMM|nr:BREX-1 system adenine-specific DNA-methyltransferase PglX [Succinivibrio faecicola]MBW7570967.1 BREX-1 system adenine-specific DNA-methyltransferase PglX [Succinivibrio faecicola]
MDFSRLKNFAPEARKILFSQIKSSLDQAIKLDGILHRNHPNVFNKLCEDLNKYGEESLIRKVAYFWFNRFCALRFMDLNGYTNSKVVSPEQEGSSIPGILSEAKSNYFDDEVVSTATKEKINNLLNGSTQSANPEAEVYRLLLISECNYWNKKMPFLFQTEDDYSEYLLPSDLLSPESILQSIRDAMTIDNCQSVEIIGWLYQYYISEKKDEIFADLKKNIKIEPNNIPAATQLFTPEWIVRYLVDNSLGRLWMLNHPESSLKESMEYYIESQEPETDFLKISTPQEIRVCDPCCGSGHMLVYAFDLLYKIYEEQGYSNTEIPKLILENNLFGLELDERASELAAFALMMKAREKDRRVFGRNVIPQICHLEKIEFTEQELSDYRNKVGSDIITYDVLETVKQFNEADNFGSLIIPKVNTSGEVLKKLKDIKLDDIFLQETHSKVVKALTTADYLSQNYHVVVTNPPYKGAGDLNSRLVSWMKDNYPDSKADLFSAFIERGFYLIKSKGYHSMVTMQSWMFLSSFEKLREKLLLTNRINALCHMANMIMGIAFGTAATIFQKNGDNKKYGYYCFVELDNIVNEKPNEFPPKNERNEDANYNGFYKTSADNFKKIPGSPIAYWVNEKITDIYPRCNNKVCDIVKPAQGLATGDNGRFLRYWHEVSFNRISLGEDADKLLATGEKKWCPCTKGGSYRKWYGNIEYVVNWEKNGYEIKNLKDENGKLRSRPQNSDFYFSSEGISWSTISSYRISFRLFEKNWLFETKGSVCFPKSEKKHLFYNVFGFLNSNLAERFLAAITPTMDFHEGPVGNLPFIELKSDNSDLIKEAIKISKEDFETSELSFNFKENCLERETGLLEKSIESYLKNWEQKTHRLALLETENNELFLKSQNIENEYSAEVKIEDISLYNNYHYKTLYKDQKEFISEIVKNLISYSVGCMFGRYSLDKEGLILCNQGETIVDFKAKVSNSSFEVDEDNVIPVLSDNWFSDDIVERFKSFLKIAFGEEHYLENLRFIEQTLNVKEKNSYSIRDYFVNEFYADHVKRYKKRPIYWMFKSPKGHFKALIYMQRYQPYTVSRARNEYLLEFRQKLDAEKQNLETLVSSGTLSKADNNAKNKRIEEIKKIIADINNYDSEIMYPLAQQNIEIDLDDGVKTNYIKFGKALEKIAGLDKKED